MQLIGLILAVVQLLLKLTELMEQSKIIDRAEAELARRVLNRDKELLREARAARKSIRRDAAAGRLRDDDGHRRD